MIMAVVLRRGLRILLLLFALHSWGVLSDGSRVLGHLEEKTCNPGTIPVVRNNATVACDCGNVPRPPGSQTEEEKVGIAYCVWDASNTSSLHAVLRATYWAGYLENQTVGDNFIVTPCPFGFCHLSSNGIRLVKSFVTDSVICGPRNRKGPLCAECNEGYAVAFNRLGFDCIKCSDQGAGIAAWLFADIVPELVLVIVYLLIDAPLLKGQMNSFLLFAQTFYAMNLYANGAMDLSVEDQNGHNGLSDWVYWLYSLWSLNFLTAAPGFPPLCIDPGMNALSQLSFQYVYAVLPFTVILAAFSIQWCYRKEPLRFGRVFRLMQRGHSCIARIQHSLGKSSSSIRNGLASFLLLAYSKLLFVSFYILAFVDLLERDGSVKRRVFLDATWRPFDQQHQVYAAPAVCVVLLFSILPALLLLFYTPILMLTNKMQCCYRVRLTGAVHESIEMQQEPKLTACGKFIQNIIMFLRTFNECFQGKYAFFAGVLFLYRIVIWAIFANTPNLSDQYVYQITVTCLLLGLHLVCKPYRRDLSWINVWDAVMYVNIIVINTLSLYHYQAWHSNLRPNKLLYAFQQILILLPILYLMGLFVVYAVYIVLKCRRKSVPTYTAFSRRGSAKPTTYGSVENNDIHFSEPAHDKLSAVGEGDEEDPSAWLRESLVGEDSLDKDAVSGLRSLWCQLCPTVCRGAIDTEEVAPQRPSSRYAFRRDNGMVDSLTVRVPAGQTLPMGEQEDEDGSRELTPQIISVSV